MIFVLRNNICQSLSKTTQDFRETNFSKFPIHLCNSLGAGKYGVVSHTVHPKLLLRGHCCFNLVTISINVNKITLCMMYNCTYPTKVFTKQKLDKIWPFDPMVDPLTRTWEWSYNCSGLPKHVFIVLMVGLMEHSVPGIDTDQSDRRIKYAIIKKITPRSNGIPYHGNTYIICNRSETTRITFLHKNYF